MLKILSPLALLLALFLPLLATAEKSEAASAALPPTSGLVTGSFTSANVVTATMWDGTTAVGTVQLTLAGRFVTGTGTTPLGTPDAFRGYSSGHPASVGWILAAAGYIVPNPPGPFHIFELRWDASGNVDGGWRQYP